MSEDELRVVFRIDDSEFRRQLGELRREVEEAKREDVGPAKPVVPGAPERPIPVDVTFGAAGADSVEIQRLNERIDSLESRWGIPGTFKEMSAADVESRLLIAMQMEQWKDVAALTKRRIVTTAKTLRERYGDVPIKDLQAEEKHLMGVSSLLSLQDILLRTTREERLGIGVETGSRKAAREAAAGEMGLTEPISDTEQRARMTIFHRAFQEVSREILTTIGKTAALEVRQRIQTTFGEKVRIFDVLAPFLAQLEGGGEGLSIAGAEITAGKMTQEKIGQVADLMMISQQKLVGRGVSLKDIIAKPRTTDEHGRTGARIKIPTIGMQYFSARDERGFQDAVLTEILFRVQGTPLEKEWEAAFDVGGAEAPIYTVPDELQGMLAELATTSTKEGLEFSAMVKKATQLVGGFYAEGEQQKTIVGLFNPTYRKGALKELSESFKNLDRDVAELLARGGDPTAVNELIRNNIKENADRYRGQAVMAALAGRYAGGSIAGLPGELTRRRGPPRPGGRGRRGVKAGELRDQLVSSEFAAQLGVLITDRITSEEEDEQLTELGGAIVGRLPVDVSVEEEEEEDMGEGPSPSGPLAFVGDARSPLGPVDDAENELSRLMLIIGDESKAGSPEWLTAIRLIPNLRMRSKIARIRRMRAGKDVTIVPEEHRPTMTVDEGLQEMIADIAAEKEPLGGILPVDIDMRRYQAKLDQKARRMGLTPEEFKERSRAMESGELMKDITASYQDAIIAMKIALTPGGEQKVLGDNLRKGLEQVFGDRTDEIIEKIGETADIKDGQWTADLKKIMESAEKGESMIGKAVTGMASGFQDVGRGIQNMENFRKYNRTLSPGTDAFTWINCA